MLKKIILSLACLSVFFFFSISYAAAPNEGPFPDADVATPAVYPGTTERVVLSAKGPILVNNHGKTIILKGLVRPSLEWNPQGQYLSPTDIQNMKKWGINVIRLDLNQNFWANSQPINVKGSYKQIIDAFIYYAIQNDIAVILDLHWTEDGHQSPMANKNSVKFWQEIASQYKDFGTVIFELFNEPYSISPDVWLTGDANYAGYQELLDAVRKVGANNLCLVNGLDYGFDLSFINEKYHLKGENVIYGSHPYDEKGQKDGSFSPNFGDVVGKYPLFFTEFGTNETQYFPKGYERVYNNILTYINHNQASYSGFAWWVQDDVFPSIIKDWSGTPMNGGEIIRSDLIHNPPSSLY